MPETYSKVPFTWPGNRPAPVPTEPDGTRWLPATDVPGFLALVADCLTASVDDWDRSAVAHEGAMRTAQIVTGELTGYQHSPPWWEVLTRNDVPAGFVLPATFAGASRDGLDEGTLLHIGVHPHHRGRGLGRALLRRATATLAGHGVWRIYCDTAAHNAPMIRLFASEGWERQPAHQRPVYGS